jgi:UDP-N-acetylglucosamine:LPS N-acetylglucosamine transferase
MIEYGGFVSEGMAIGIEDGSKFVQRSAVDMAGGAIPTYTPSSPAGSVSNSRSSITLSPTIYISGGSEGGKGIKEQVMEALEETFEHLNFLYEPEGEY